MKIFVTFPQRNRGKSGANNPDGVKLVIMQDGLDEIAIVKNLNAIFGDGCFGSAGRSSYYPLEDWDKHKQFYPLGFL